MAIEIERKFLVVGDFRPFANRKIAIHQGYLPTTGNITVRVRTENDQGYLTVKGPGNTKGISRGEWNYAIPYPEALELFALCGQQIEKNRYHVPFEGHLFEVDEFLGSNKGLVVAEIELTDESEAFFKPTWLGVEVTGNPLYYNASLAKKPYSTW